MSRKVKFPVKYVTKQQLQEKSISLEYFPNAGPNPNITGMRNLYWGQDALLLKHGRYVYKVPTHIYNRF